MMSPAATDDPTLGPSSANLDAAVDVRRLTHVYPPPSGRRARGKAGQSRHHANAAPAHHRPALDDVTFSVRPGEIFGVLGPNGGGKSTLFNILSTLVRATTGQANICGFDVSAQPDQVRRLLGVVFQMPSLDIKLTARENLRHQGRLYGISGSELERRIDALLEQFDLTPRQHEHVERFSGGMRRRVELAKSLLHDPRLLLLDEPSTGLDPGVRVEMWKHLQSLRDQHGITVLLTTHLMDEADRCDRLAILSQGKLIAVDTPQRLKARIGGDVITVEVPPEQLPTIQSLRDTIDQRFGPWPDDTAPAVVDRHIHMEKPDGPRFIAELASALPGEFRSITVGQPTLEDVFMHLTGQRLSDVDQN